MSGDSCGTISGSTAVTVSGGNDTASLATGCYQYTFTGTDKAGNSTSRQESGIVKVDRGNPTGGSITANDGNAYSNTGTIAISTTAFSDAETAVASTWITRAVGTLTNDACGGLSGSTAVTVSGGNDGASLGTGCYQYTFSATDKAGNTSSTTSSGREG